MRPVAIFDIDGTIFRSSLLVELVRELVRRRVFPQTALGKVRKAEAKWLDRQGGYDNYIIEVVGAYLDNVKGKPVSKVIAASRRVIKAQKFRTYRYTRELLAKLRKKYFTIAISGSPWEVVREYNKFLKFDKFYGTEYAFDEHGRYTGKVLHEPPRYKREVIARHILRHNLSLKGSIGVGDTESDIGYLSIVENPIAFNPNSVLANIAKKKNWPIVIERKDLIVEFKPKKVKYLKI